MAKHAMLLRIPAVVMLAAIATALPSQTPLFHDPTTPGVKVQAVQYLYPEQVTLAAGKPSPVKLHFRIAQGLHINSHDPKEKFLIPTVLSLPDGSGVTLREARYPDGTEFVLPADPSTKLNVYTGEFTIDAQLVASPGDHLVQAHLHYQACDENACLPPKTIPVPIDVIGK